MEFLPKPDRFVVEYDSKTIDADQLRDAVLSTVVGRRARRMLGRLGGRRNPGEEVEL
ncbi:MAG: hypothetical protein V3U90_08750 [Dehalococcoidia bacterium]